MLKKYRKAAPSLVLHLHPTHFRFEQQDGSFSYNSPMRTLLEHVKSQTIPHDMLDDLKHAGVKFYESMQPFCVTCLTITHISSQTASSFKYRTIEIAQQYPRQLQCLLVEIRISHFQSITTTNTLHLRPMFRTPSRLQIARRPPNPKVDQAQTLLIRYLQNLKRRT